MQNLYPSEAQLRESTNVHANNLRIEMFLSIPRGPLQKETDKHTRLIQAMR
jgi:hypothetical protein